MEFLVIWLIFAIICAFVAPSKGRSGAMWFVIGLFFGIFALALLALLPSVRTADAAPQRAAPDGPPWRGPERDCPYCAERILVAAKVCKHCGRDVAWGGAKMNDEARQLHAWTTVHSAVTWPSPRPVRNVP